MSNNTEKKRGNPNWKPGLSGNPSGRPKAAHDFAMLARTKSEEAFSVIMEILSGPYEARERLKAAEIILDRAYGKCTTDIASLRDEMEIPDDIKRMTPEQLVKELKEMQ